MLTVPLKPPEFLFLQKEKNRNGSGLRDQFIRTRDEYLSCSAECAREVWIMRRNVTEWNAPKWAIAMRNWMNRNSTVAASSLQIQFSRITAGSNAKKNCSSDPSSKDSPTSMGQSEYSMNGMRANSSSWNALPLIGYSRLRGKSMDSELLRIYTDHFE